jgi:hypothetical protein
MLLCIEVVWYHHLRGSCDLHLQLLFFCHMLDCRLLLEKESGIIIIIIGHLIMSVTPVHSKVKGVASVCSV